MFGTKYLLITIETVKDFIAKEVWSVDYIGL